MDGQLISILEMHKFTHSYASQFAFSRLSVEKRVQLEDGFIRFCEVGRCQFRQSCITTRNILRLLPGEEEGMGRGGVGGRPGDSIYMIIGYIKADVGFVTVN